MEHVCWDWTLGCNEHNNKLSGGSTGLYWRSLTYRSQKLHVKFKINLPALSKVDQTSPQDLLLVHPHLNDSYRDDHCHKAWKGSGNAWIIIRFTSWNSLWVYKLRVSSRHRLHWGSMLAFHKDVGSAHFCIHWRLNSITLIKAFNRTGYCSLSSVSHLMSDPRNLYRSLIFVHSLKHLSQSFFQVQAVCIILFRFYVCCYVSSIQTRCRGKEFPHVDRLRYKSQARGHRGQSRRRRLVSTTCVRRFGDLKQDSAGLQISDPKTYEVDVVDVVLGFAEVPCTDDGQRSLILIRGYMLPHGPVYIHAHTLETV